jgi:mannose-1-phosphate guanylyltransferase
MIIPVVLSGGSGTRLWPLSRSDFPKQFLNLFEGHSLFQITLNRIKSLASLHSPIVVCNEAHRFIVCQQAQDINFQLSTILLEPAPRNSKSRSLVS